MKPFTIDLLWQRETPGTHLYVCSEHAKSSALIQNVYIKKSAFNGAKPPNKISVTIAPAEAKSEAA